MYCIGYAGYRWNLLDRLRGWEEEIGRTGAATGIMNRCIVGLWEVQVKVVGKDIYPLEIIFVTECEMAVDKYWRGFNTLLVNLCERVERIRAIVGWY